MEGGVGFIIEGWEVSLHSSQKGANLLILWRPPPTPPPPPILPTSPSIFQILSTLPPPPLPCHLQPPPPLLFLFSCFFGWVGDHATFNVLFYLMIKWISICMSSLGTLYKKDLDVCFMQQGVSFTEVWHNVVFYWYSDLISHTQTHTTHSGASRLTHSYKYKK